METVDDLGISEKTLVFTNDNGGLTEEVNRPWRGTRNTTFEGGIRVPVFFVKIYRAELVCNELIRYIFSNTCDHWGGSLEQTHPLDGSNMSRLFLMGRKVREQKILIEATGSVRLPRSAVVGGSLLVMHFIRSGT